MLISTPLTLATSPRWALALCAALAWVAPGPAALAQEPTGRDETPPTLAAPSPTPAAQPASQSVALAGVLGAKALLVINGGQPRSLAVGQSYQGVKLLRLQGTQAEVLVDDEPRTLRLGAAAVSVKPGGFKPTGNQIVLSADARGHFMTQGQINGQAVPMMVDTGASMVSLSVEQARRIGLDYQRGKPLTMSTANGTMTGWQVKLDSLRVGEVLLYGVDAVVTAGVMPYVLLGNNFLARFQLNRDNNLMVLEKRF